MDSLKFGCVAKSDRNGRCTLCFILANRWGTLLIGGFSIAEAIPRCGCVLRFYTFLFLGAMNAKDTWNLVKYRFGVVDVRRIERVLILMDVFGSDVQSRTRRCIL